MQQSRNTVWKMLIFHCGAGGGCSRFPPPVALLSGERQSSRPRRRITLASAPGTGRGSARSGNSYDSFNSVIRTFTLANQNRLDYLKDEASSFIHHAVERFNVENVVISFSGGKDSTVTADLVVNALCENNVILNAGALDTDKAVLSIEGKLCYTVSHTLNA